MKKYIVIRPPVFLHTHTQLSLPKLGPKDLKISIFRVSQGNSLPNLSLVKTTVANAELPVKFSVTRILNMSKQSRFSIHLKKPSKMNGRDQNK